MFENGNNNEMNNVQFDNQFSGGYDTTVTGVDNVTKSGRGKKAALIGGISAAVIAGGSVTAYAASDTVKNQVKLRLSKPENYYAWVTEKNSKTIGETVSEYYKERLEQYQKGQSIDVTFSYEPSQEAKDIAAEELDGRKSDELEQLLDIIKNTDRYSATVNGKTKKGNSASSASFEMDSKHILGIDIALDADAMEYFFRIPELKDQWVCLNVNMDELEDEYSSYSRRTNIFDTYKAALEDPASFITPEELEDAVNRYAGVWGNFVDSVKIEKSEQLDVCDIQVKYTVATVSLTEKDMDKLGLEFLKEAREDEVLRRIFVDKLGEFDSEAEFREMIDDEIEDIEEDLEENDYDGEIFAVIDTYIDPSGTIRGFRVADEDDEMSVTAIFGKDGDNIRGEFVISTDDEDDDFRVQLSANEDKKVYSGDIKLFYTDYDYHYDEEEEKYVSGNIAKTAVLNFSGVELKDEDKMYFNGDFSLEVPDFEIPVNISCNTDGKRETISYNICIDDTDYGRLLIDYALDFGADFDIPDNGGAFVVKATEIEDVEIEDYINEKDLKAFIKLTLEDIGFKEESAREAADSFVDGYNRRKEQLSGYDWDDEDYDWDDEDYDWDDEDYDWDDEDFDWDDEDYEWDDEDYEWTFDPSEYKYEDYKDYMTEEQFNDWMKLMEEFTSESSSKAS